MNVTLQCDPRRRADTAAYRNVLAHTESTGRQCDPQMSPDWGKICQDQGGMFSCTDCVARGGFMDAGTSEGARGEWRVYARLLHVWLPWDRSCWRLNRPTGRSCRAVCQ